MPNTTFDIGPPVAGESPFRQGADAWLKKLIRLNREEARNPVNIFDLNFHSVGLIVQELVDPRLRVPDVAGEGHLALFSACE